MFVRDIHQTSNYIAYYCINYHRFTFFHVINRSTVYFHYDFYFEGQDDPYDSTRILGRPEEIKLGDGQALPGIEIAVRSMHVDEKAEFIIAPQ